LAVWTSYPAPYKHFSDAASDAKVNGKDKAELKGLAAKLSSDVTLMNIAVWTRGSIEPCGDTKDQRLQALRKKIYQHRDSPSHKTAETILAQARTETIETVVADSNRELFDSTCKVFRTVYYVMTL